MHAKASSIVRYSPHFAALSALLSRPAGLVSSLISFMISLLPHNTTASTCAISLLPPVYESVAYLVVLTLLIKPGADTSMLPYLRMFMKVHTKGHSEISCGVVGDSKSVVYTSGVFSATPFGSLYYVVTSRRRERSDSATNRFQRFLVAVVAAQALCIHTFVSQRGHHSVVPLSLRDKT
jgi:hypothetical protein